MQLQWPPQLLGPVLSQESVIPAAELAFTNANTWTNVKEFLSAETPGAARRLPREIGRAFLAEGTSVREEQAWPVRGLKTEGGSRGMEQRVSRGGRGWPT